MNQSLTFGPDGEVILDCANSECDAKFTEYLKDYVSGVDIEGWVLAAAADDDDWYNGYCSCCTKDVLLDDSMSEAADDERKEAA